MSSTRYLPQWAPRIRKDQLRRLYLNDAQGIYDQELIDEVGYGLLARCQSFLAANAAAQGRAECPLCSRSIAHGRDRTELLRCEDCGWELTWGEFFATFQGKQLSGAEPVLELFREFVHRFPTAHGDREKLLCIDRLIHGFHWYQTQGFTRPVAINLIEGRLADVIAFLDSLTYSDASTPGMQETHGEWIQRSQNARRWTARKPLPEEA